MKFDLVIHNAVIVTVNPDFDIIKNGVIGIRWIRGQIFSLDN